MSFSQHFLDAAAAKRSFYVDALSSTVPLRIDLDIQLTLIASTFYQVLAQRLAPPLSNGEKQNHLRQIRQCARHDHHPI
ncbi:MAG: hypothetical protein OXD43_13545 [Bacteroidetes bacterium]|nr:hypothetical protein [Bacteroidota bacterium]